MAATYNSVRRYYLRMRIAAMLTGDSVLASVWRWKQEGQPGTPLPADFAYSEVLTKAGYTTQEDLNGADAAELRMAAKLTAQEATTVIAATIALVQPIPLVVAPELLPTPVTQPLVIDEPLGPVPPQD